MTCPFAFDDAAYVLGALSPNERQRFQEHLPTCAPCTSGVSELAGLPGLLSRLPEGDVDTLLTEERHDDDAPVSLLPRLQTKARRERRKSQWRVAAIGGAVAASVMLIAFLFTGNAFQSSNNPSTQQPVAAASAPVDFTPVNGAPVKASVTMAEKKWGTMLQLNCTYTAPAYGSPPEYKLIAKTDSGKDTQIAAWEATPYQEVHVPAATAIQRDNLASLEIQNESGASVMSVKL